MNVFAIGDLHLPGGDEKPMNVFGSHWDGHFQRISKDWRSRVTEEDVVLIPGDISWAMQLRDAVPDLEAIAALPGRKVILKGNHDYWWNSLTQVKGALPQGMQAIQHNAVDMGCAVVCGTRGWTLPTPETPLSKEDQRIYDREVLRLELALKDGMKFKGDRPLIVMMHYPPLYDMERDTDFTRLLEQYPVTAVVYGHLHGAGLRVKFNGEHRGVRYQLVSCDGLDFRLAQVPLDKN